MLKKLLGTGILFSSLCIGTSVFAATGASGSKSIDVPGNAVGLVNNAPTSVGYGGQDQGLASSNIYLYVNGDKVLTIDPPEPWIN